MDFSQNQLIGSIPSFSTLRRLRELTLFDNQLTGSIPSFSELASFSSLNVQNNKLDGLIGLNSSSLRVLDISNNRLIGDLSFLAGLPSLQSLTLHKHRSIRHFHASCPSSLRQFTAINCGLYGPVPTSWSFAWNLRTVVLRDNHLTLPLPNLLHVNLLDLTHNNLDGNFIEGVSSMWRVNEAELYPARSNMSVLLLANNQFRGSLPDFMFMPALVSSGLFVGLSTLNLAGMICGSLYLFHLSIQATSLSGNIPIYDGAHGRFAGWTKLVQVTGRQWPAARPPVDPAR